MFNATIEAAPAAFPFRDYQLEAIESVDKSINEGDNRPLIVMATGSGKTPVLAEISRRRDEPVVILAHTEELIDQAIAKYHLVDPSADIGRVQGEYNEVGHQITVASIQTFSRPNRFKQAFPNQSAINRIGMVAIDEGHHAAAASYQYFIEQFDLNRRGLSNRVLLGLTATPQRSDDLDLRGTFDRVAFSYSIRRGIEEGYLCNLTGYTLVFDNSDMAEVKIRSGEFVAGQLERAVRKVARDDKIVGTWTDQAKLPDGSYRRTIVFGVSIEHAEELKAAFVNAGVRTGVVHGNMPLEERQKAIRQLHNGEIDVLCNCQILTEGFDCPAVSCIVLARPCHSKSLFLQMVGRGTRIFPGKENCLVLDVCDTSRDKTIDTVITLGAALGLRKHGPVRDALQAFEEEGNLIKRTSNLVRLNTLGGRYFDPLRDPLGGVHGVNFRWNHGSSGLTLSLPKDNLAGQNQWLIVYCRPDLLWDIYKVKGYNNDPHRSEKLVNWWALPDQTSAIQAAENHVLREFPGHTSLAGRDASWRSRSEPASDKQVELLRKLYRNSRISPFMNGTPTKADAAVLIDQRMAASVMVQRPRSSEMGVAA